MKEFISREFIEVEKVIAKCSPLPPIGAWPADGFLIRISEASPTPPLKLSARKFLAEINTNS